LKSQKFDIRYYIIHGDIVTEVRCQFQLCDLILE
jgi:hypothetical protein